MHAISFCFQYRQTADTSCTCRCRRHLPSDRSSNVSGAPSSGRGALAYKARQHNGIWATPPAFTMGQFPNLFSLLSPVYQRPKVFYLGSKQYDLVKLGLNTDSLEAHVVQTASTATSLSHFVTRSTGSFLCHQLNTRPCEAGSNSTGLAHSASSFCT